MKKFFKYFSFFFIALFLTLFLSDYFSKDMEEHLAPLIKKDIVWSIGGGVLLAIFQIIGLEKFASKKEIEDKK